MTDAIVVKAHAKANLFLRVLAREASGYHTIETLFTLLELHDTVRLEPSASGIDVHVEGADVGPPEKNLAYRAAQLLLPGTKLGGVRIHITKRIPVGAGLGGGSSDAAATLHGINGLASDAAPEAEILQMAAKLGSDVPFLASGAPMTLAWGRGERMFQIPPPGQAPALLVVPDFGVNTAKAYELLDAGWRDEGRRRGLLLDRDAFSSWGGIGRLGGNDFEVPIFGKEPALRELFERAARTRPLLVRMTGSGSGLIAIYRTAADRDAASMELRGESWSLLPTETRGVPAERPASPK